MNYQRHSFSLTKSDYKGNGLFARKFKNGIKFENNNSRLTIESFQIYNSFFNIKAEYNNNIIKYTWIDGVIHTIKIPDGYYEVDALDLFLKQQLIELNCYAYNSDKSDYKFFHGFETDINLYSQKINIYYFPDQTLFNSLGYHVPDNATWTVPTEKKLISIDIGGLNDYFGMSTSIFPKVGDNQLKNYYYQSNVTANLLKINNLLIMCNLLNSPYNIENQFLTQVRINAAFGNMISLQSGMDQKYSIANGTYNEIKILICDDNFQPIQLLDSNMTINLIIETITNDK